MENTHFYMKGYLIFCLTATVFVFGRLHFFASGIGRSTKTLFERLLRGTLGAPMSFFETTPLGRITNRFSFDTETIDAALFQRINGAL
jgi:ABC-type bacteriocin/lantibiotic exporter with double-glycine peptidase domain